MAGGQGERAGWYSLWPCSSSSQPGGSPRLKSESGVESHHVLEIRIFQQHAPMPKSWKAPRDYHIID